MEIRQGFKFRLKPKRMRIAKMRRFAGCCRFVWNKALALEKENYEETGKCLGYNKLAGLLVEWKKDDGTAFLKDAHSQILQQTLRNLDKAYLNFFEKRAGFPKFKKKGLHDSFSYPQGFKIDENNSRIYLPKIGWIRYVKHRRISGIPKNVTVSQSCGKWYVSIQTERIIAEPVHSSQSEIGIDLGLAHFVSFSDGSWFDPVNVFKKYSRKLARLQRLLAKKVKFSSNWKKVKFRIQKLHKKIADIRHDFLHKATSAISKNHAMVVVEDLQVKNMSASASGTLEKPGRNVKSKSGLNKSILDQGWGEFVRQLEYKLRWLGGCLIRIAPQYTSQKCSQCGYISQDNRKTQAKFKCMACGFEANADHNAALNILAAGHAAMRHDGPIGRHAVSVCGAERARASALKQEPACDAAL